MALFTLLVSGGTNDSWCGAPLGELKYEGIEETDLFSILPAISRFAKRLHEELPETKVVFIGNCDIKAEVTVALSKVSERYGFTYVGLADVEKVNGHPTELGMEQICNQIIAKI